jgi:hypothetical protein
MSGESGTRGHLIGPPGTGKNVYTARSQADVRAQMNLGLSLAIVPDGGKLL